MPRVPRSASFRGAAKASPSPAASEDEPGAALLASLGPDRPKKKRGPTARGAREGLARSLAELPDVLAKRRTAEPRHLVALYVYLHEQVHRVRPEELTQAKEYAAAVSAAKRLVAQTFGDDFVETIEFMRWVWQRQRDRAKWRRAQGEEPSRIGWRLQFVSRSLVTDYRAATFERAAGGSKR